MEKNKMDENFRSQVLSSPFLKSLFSNSPAAFEAFSNLPAGTPVEGERNPLKFLRSLDMDKFRHYAGLHCHRQNVARAIGYLLQYPAKQTSCFTEEMKNKFILLVDSLIEKRREILYMRLLSVRTSQEEYAICKFLKTADLSFIERSDFQRLFHISRGFVEKDKDGGLLYQDNKFNDFIVNCSDDDYEMIKSKLIIKSVEITSDLEQAREARKKRELLEVEISSQLSPHLKRRDFI